MQEAIKPRLLQDGSEKDFKVALYTLRICLETGLKLLHPVMPFITEELYQRIQVAFYGENYSQGGSKIQSIMLEQYPGPIQVCTTIYKAFYAFREWPTSIKVRFCPTTFAHGRENSSPFLIEDTRDLNLIPCG